MQTVDNFSTTTAGFLLDGVQDKVSTHSLPMARQIADVLLDSHNADSKLKSVWAHYLKDSYDFFNDVVTTIYYNASQLEDGDLAKRIQARMRTRLADACELVDKKRRKFTPKGLTIVTETRNRDKVGKLTNGDTTTAKRIGKLNKRGRARVLADFLAIAGVHVEDLESIKAELAKIESK